jgi:hypothetical protein
VSPSEFRIFFDVYKSESFVDNELLENLVTLLSNVLSILGVEAISSEALNVIDVKEVKRLGTISSELIISLAVEAGNIIGFPGIDPSSITDSIKSFGVIKLVEPFD